MIRSSRFAIPLAVLLFLTAAGSAPANAWPFGHLLHLHPCTTRTQDARITVQLSNNSGLVQQVKVSGHTYTLLPHDGLTIKAQPGTEVIAASDGFRHRAGDVLFAITPNLNLETITLD